ncbi:MAG: hypothetical protein COV35_09075 [Alphaproteobacteria bacterium CG11_big_fil_rev_8_21_14_0_20_39_49]|nr:MAG: hypothetical protein COV35_09075 [Alphaproteobacteria bacterium CG11_big_fil_rev_8_21_14_0_20_39_49]
MAVNKKDNEVEKIEPAKKTDDKTNPKTKNKVTNFLFVITWAVIGGLSFQYVQTSQKISALLSDNEKNGDKINNLEVENKVLTGKIDDADRRIEKLSVDMQVFAEKYSEKEDIFAKKDEGSSDEFVEALSDSLAVEEDKNEVVQNSLTPEEYEKMAYDSQAISAGLSDVSDRTAFLEEKIDIVSEQLEQAKLNAFSNNLVISAVKLREAVNNSVSFEKELRAFKFFAGEDSELKYNISVLEENSRNGIVNIQKLTKDFDDIADEILNVSRKSKDAPTAVDRLTLKLSNLVQIRKIEANENGNETEDIIARGIKALKNGNVEKAIEEAEKLTGDSRILISNWLKDANSFVESKKASEEIFVHVSNKVAASEG